MYTQPSRPHQGQSLYTLRQMSSDVAVQVRGVKPGPGHTHESSNTKTSVESFEVWAVGEPDASGTPKPTINQQGPWEKAFES